MSWNLQKHLDAAKQKHCEKKAEAQQMLITLFLQALTF